MRKSLLGDRGGFTAPDQKAAAVGYEILKTGGTAIEAMVAAAAAISVTYPHMNGIGGDAFWLIKKKGKSPVGISGCGYSASKASVKWYNGQGIVDSIPPRGGLSCVTVPGAIASWKKALSLVDNKKSLSDLLDSAIVYAREGFTVTDNQSNCTKDKLTELRKEKGFSETFLVDDQAPETGFLLKQPSLADTLKNLCHDGLDSYYRGAIAKQHSDFLSDNGSPLRETDFFDFDAEFMDPINTRISKGRLYNLPAPTQGVSSLMILALYDKLPTMKVDSFDHIHALVEITKHAFLKRNNELGDPRYMSSKVQDWLRADKIDLLLKKIDFSQVLPWPYHANKGDTIWMGAIDAEGTAVSFIQSVFWEFGSGLVCPDTGVFFQNRGAGFSLQPGPNQLFPRKKPFHTLNPAIARLNDGRIMVFGTMGGDGQPQTQSAIFSRYAYFDYNLQKAISMPRWLLGKTWGDTGTSLKLESRFESNLIHKLTSIGHSVEVLPDYSDLVGHAGALVKNVDGVIEGASDPRSNGASLIL